MSTSSSSNVIVSENYWLNSPSPRREVIFSWPTSYSQKIFSKISNLLIKSNRKEKGCFCVEKELPVSSIDVTVKNVGKLQFPLSEELIKILTSISTEGDQALLDKTVCDNNEIKANKLNVTINDNLFEKMLYEMGQELGLLETTSLEPRLHNMLICGSGQYFKHQNVKQTDDVIATLVITLPVEHVGGDLIVKHNIEKHIFYSEDVNTNNFKCAAFYSDCYHAAENITQGYQITLTYNLISLPKVTYYSLYSDLELETLVKKYFSGEEVNKVDNLHLIYFLDHSYTEHNLRWNMLKGTDIKNGSAMYNAAQILNLVPHLVLGEISKNSENDYDELSIEEEGVKVNFWIDSNNKKLPYGKLISLSVCCTTENKNFKPCTNDEDMFMNVYRYHRAAIVLWPISNDIRMKFILNYTEEKKEFFEMLKVPSKQEMIVKIILNARKYLHDKESLRQKDYLVCLVDFAITVDDRKVAFELLSYFLWVLLELDITVCLVKLESKYTISFVIELLQKWWKNGGTCLLNNIYDIVINLVRYNVSVELVQFVLVKECISFTKHFHPLTIQAKELLKACELVKGCHASTIQNSFVDKLLTSHKFDFIKFIIPFISDLKKNDIFIRTPWFKKLKNYAISEITKKKLKFYKLPNDWSAAYSIPCTCNACLILSQFLLSKHKTKKILTCHDKTKARHIQKCLTYLTPNSIRILIDGKSPKFKVMLLKTEEFHLTFRNEYNKYNSHLFDLNSY